MIAILVMCVVGWYAVKVCWWVVSNWDAELKAAQERLGL
jgi:hypothetical protein